MQEGRGTLLFSEEKAISLLHLPISSSLSSKLSSHPAGVGMKAKATRVSIKWLNTARQDEDTTKNDYRSRVLDRIGCMERKMNTMKAKLTQIRYMIEEDSVDVEANACIEMEGIFSKIMVVQSTMMEEFEAVTQELIDMGGSIPSVNVVDAYVDFGFNRVPNFIAKLTHKTQALTQELSNTKALVEDILRSINKIRPT